MCRITAKCYEDSNLYAWDGEKWVAGGVARTYKMDREILAAVTAAMGNDSFAGHPFGLKTIELTWSD